MKAHPFSYQDDLTGKVQFPYKGGAYCFHPSEIIRLEAQSNYTYIHLSDHKRILMAKVLAAYETLLQPFGFVRTHKSHLVNTQHVHSVSRAGEIIMNDQSIAELSRRKRKMVMAMFNHNKKAS